MTLRIEIWVLRLLFWSRPACECSRSSRVCLTDGRDDNCSDRGRRGTGDNFRVTRTGDSFRVTGTGDNFRGTETGDNFRGTVT